MDLAEKLNRLRVQANTALTIYEKTRFDYAYMELVLKEAPDVHTFRHEIRAFQSLCLIYTSVYEEDLYGQFLVLLQKLTDKLC